MTELERLAFGASSPYDADLEAAARRLARASDETRRAERARVALAGIERATIGTLHGVAYGIARGHALAHRPAAGVRGRVRGRLRGVGERRGRPTP